MLLLRALLACLGLVACDSEVSTERAPVRASAAAPLLELAPEFLKRAHSALLERVGSQAQLLEMRAEGRQLSYILVVGDRLAQIDYIENAALRSSAPATEVGTPVGKIYGPDLVDTLGEGPLKENLFPLTEVNIAGISQAFPVALRAVDPDFGRVTGLVVRRLLPVSTAIRARIYVDSPKMSGSIDTNERGVPLKKY